MIEAMGGVLNGVDIVHADWMEEALFFGATGRIWRSRRRAGRRWLLA